VISAFIKHFITIQRQPIQLCSKAAAFETNDCRASAIVFLMVMKGMKLGELEDEITLKKQYRNQYLPCDPVSQKKDSLQI
jgi:hypothetical protein